MTKHDDVLPLLQIAWARAGIYRMLASLFLKELTLEQIGQLSKEDLSGLEASGTGFAEGIHDMKRALRQVHEGTREDLAVDYAHTFLASGTTKNEKRACPFESVFTSQNGLLMQEARDDVYRFMLAEHVEPNEQLHIPEDHIAFEFQFMALLCDRMAEAFEVGDQAEGVRVLRVQRAFRDAHLENWIDDFCDAVGRCCRTSFYRGVGKVTRMFVHIDADLIDESERLTFQKVQVSGSCERR
jgi:putative dimethyl sulfoxide reductase chaperone